MTEGTKDYVYPLEQPATTLWYHDHRMDFTGPQVYKGLAGFHLVRDDEEDNLGLPHGDRDIPLMITDRAFAEDGSFHYPSVDPSLRGEPGVVPEFMSGVLGDCVLVNGAPWPVLEVTNTRYRFRLLNASNARRYRLALDPPPREGPPIHIHLGRFQVLTAGGGSADPGPFNVGWKDTVNLGSGGQAEVLVEFDGYRGKYVFHCHNLEHEDMMMMANLEVV